jgi:hypothetical protein
MSDSTRLKYLRIALVLVGIIFIFGVYSLMIAWPSGWTWHTGHSDYPLMIVGIYATLGVFRLRAVSVSFITVPIEIESGVSSTILSDTCARDSKSDASLV